MFNINVDILRELGTFLVGTMILAGCGLFIFEGRGNEEQAWLMIGVVAAYFFNRQQQSSTVREVMRQREGTK